MSLSEMLEAAASRLAGHAVYVHKGKCCLTTVKGA